VLARRRAVVVPTSQSSERPAIAIGHVTLKVSDVVRSAEFYKTLGLRAIVEREAIAILELRGGTHLLLFKGRSNGRRRVLRTFDFMVDDADAFRDDVTSRGIETSAVRDDRLSGHRMFELTDPDGHVVTVLSDHTEGRPV
jgi:catechol 2,3-dioxygenase-like lactoylglutathione lyase family enzyme